MIRIAPKHQLPVGIALVALMAMTRGHHFAGVDLPSASWAVFFLAGVLLRPKWVFPALFLEATLLDLAAIQWAGVSDWCMSPAYWMLIPAYGSLWLGGKLYARWHRDQPGSFVTLGLCAMVAAFVCYLFSGGGFLYFSGRYPDPSLALLIERIGTYYPRYLGNLALYVGTAAVIFTGLRALHAQREGSRA